MAEAVRRYYPALDARALQPGYAGVRPRLAGPDAPPADWSIQGPREHGVANLIELIGIDSPGLTSSLAIADHVAALLR